MTSMSPEAIVTAFAEASEKLAPCVGRLTDLEIMPNVLIPIPFDQTHGGLDNLVALVTTDPEYFQAMSNTFTIPPTGRRRGYQHLGRKIRDQDSPTGPYSLLLSGGCATSSLIT